MYRNIRIRSRAFAWVLLALVAAFAVACGSGLTLPSVELRVGPTPELPDWATEARLISVNKWSDRVILGTGGVRYVVDQFVGSPDSLFQIFYDVEGRTREIPDHVLIRTGDVYLVTVQTSQMFDSDGFLKSGKWKFPGAVSVVGLFDDTVIELYE